MFEESAPMTPNGLLLGVNPGDQIAQAVVAEGTNADPKYDIGGFGRLIAKDDKIDFEKRLDVYKTQLMAH